LREDALAELLRDMRQAPAAHVENAVLALGRLNEDERQADFDNQHRGRLAFGQARDAHELVAVGVEALPRFTDTLADDVQRRDVLARPEVFRRDGPRDVQFIIHVRCLPPGGGAQSGLPERNLRESDEEPAAD